MGSTTSLLVCVRALSVCLSGNPLMCGEDAELTTIIGNEEFRDNGDGTVFIAQQDESIQSKNIVEKISLESKFSLTLHIVATHSEIFCLHVVWVFLSYAAFRLIGGYVCVPCAPRRPDAAHGVVVVMDQWRCNSMEPTMFFLSVALTVCVLHRFNQT